GQSPLHRPDAGWRSGRHTRDRRSGRDQRGAHRLSRAGARRRSAGGAARGVAGGAHGRGRRAACRRGSGAMILSPGATIGILGGGQLGRMLAVAALKLGLRSHIFAPEAMAPAYDAAAARTVAAFDDEAALARFAEAVDVVTFEFDNVPTATVEFLAERVAVRPGVRALAQTQDRLTEKTFLRDLGLKTAPFAKVEDAGALVRAVAELGRPAILKTRRFGYDGKGQSLIREGSNVAAVHSTLGPAPMILEGFVAFEREVSVVAARSLEGEIVAYDLCENEHE